MSTFIRRCARHTELSFFLKVSSYRPYPFACEGSPNNSSFVSAPENTVKILQTNQFNCLCFHDVQSPFRPLKYLWVCVTFCFLSVFSMCPLHIPPEICVLENWLKKHYASDITWRPSSCTFSFFDLDTLHLDSLSVVPLLMVISGA